MSHLDAYQALASASHFFSAKGDKTPSKRHILMSAVTRVLVTFQRSPRHKRKQPSIWDLRPPHSLDETTRLPGRYQKTVTESPTELSLHKNLKKFKHDNSLI